jgi:alkylhydroperoxidase family enzyme
MRTIQIEVSDEVAEKFTQLSPKQKQELTSVISRWAKDARTLREVMDDISKTAKERGLTPEILEELLKDE